MNKILPRGFADFYRLALGQKSDAQIQALLAGPSVKAVRLIPSRFDFSALKNLVSEFQLTLPPSTERAATVRERVLFDDAMIVSNDLAGRLAQCTAFEEGKFYLQSIPSYLVIKFLPLQDAEYILDLCASPGGKALHCYDRMKRDKPVIVNEPAGARRMRLTSVLKLYGADGLPRLGIDGGLICQFVVNTIPLIILDVPCSGEAHILGQPQRRKEWTPRQTRMLAQRQLALAVSAIHALQPGGLLLYSTCALSPFENELLIGELLTRFGDALEPQNWPVNNPGELVAPDADYTPLAKVQDTQIDPKIVQTAWRFRPTDFGEPFFAILLKKIKSTFPKKTVEPCPIHYERMRPKNHFRIVKTGPGRREFMVPIIWPELPPLPYLHMGR
ncbi:MAG: hypothetical protein WC975_15965 [Phycisphaerae bacterium]